MTNVPPPVLTSAGFVPPTEADILTGVQADLNQAFGTTLNFGSVINPTPQGQIAVTETAIIGEANSLFCELANAVDPAFATGRWQDAIGRIYFLQRLPGQSTVVQCLCIGLAGTVILPDALALSTDGNLYFCVTGGVIPLSGNITLEFACQSIGPIPCPSHSVNKIYRSIPGWDSIDNLSDGVLGTNVETRAAFEIRREQSVALNTVGFLTSVLASVLSVAGVLDAYVTDNPNNYDVAATPDCVITGSIAGTTLTVASIQSGAVKVGQSVTGASGTNVSVQTGTVITADLGGGAWTVNHSQTVTLTTMNLGGVVMGPHELYVGVIGGDHGEVATAIWKKKSPGCPYWPGNTTVVVYDANVQYAPPGVPYTVIYEQPPSLPFVVKVNIANSSIVPSGATEQIQAAVIAAFSGADGGPRVKMGSVVYANRFYRGINALGDWAEIVSLFLGATSEPTAEVTARMGASFNGVATGTSLVVTGIAGYLSPGDPIAGTGIPAGTTIDHQASGSTGGNGTYITSQATTVNGATTSKSSVLNVTAVAVGTVAVAQVAFDTLGNVLDGTTITSFGTGAGSTGTYHTNSIPQSFGSESVLLVGAAATRIAVTIDQAPTITTACIQVNLV